MLLCLTWTPFLKVESCELCACAGSVATLETLDSSEVGAWDTEISEARVAPDLSKEGCNVMSDDHNVYYLSETAEEGLVLDLAVRDWSSL